MTSGEKMDITETIHKHLIGKFKTDSLETDESILEQGLLDSAGIFELIIFLEKEFEITVEDEEIVPDNFDSVDTISAMVKTKTS